MYVKHKYRILLYLNFERQLRDRRDVSLAHACRGNCIDSFGMCAEWSHMVIMSPSLHPVKLWSLRIKHFGYTSEFGYTEFGALEDVSLYIPHFQIPICSLRSSKISGRREQPRK